MQEDTKGKKAKRRGKRKFGYYLYAVTMLILTVANITLATLLLTHVQEIRVSGTKYTDKSEIISWIEEDPLTVNSLYTLWKYKFGRYRLPVYLSDIDVSLSAPWRVRVKVQEKQMIACVLTDDQYVYFDAEGLVLQKGETYHSDFPLIEGLKVKKAKLFERLDVENEKVFSYIMDVTERIKEENLSPDRLLWEDDSMNLYFEDVCVQLGKSNYEQKIPELPPVLEKLDGEEGTLHMEHYTGDSKNISFEKKKY